MRIDACFDSHVHWPATGEFVQRLQLDHLLSPQEILKLRPEKQHFRGEWLIGFGWDDNKWTIKPTRELLDRWFPNSPVGLSRCDGHALWCNTEALKRAGLMGGVAPADSKGGRIERDEKGVPTGLLVDKACEIVENLIPQPSDFEVRRHLLEGAKLFNKAGYTHIRDMTCDETQWNEAIKIDRTGLLTLAVEEFFWVKDPSGLDSVLTLLEKAKKEAPENLRVMGIKIFLDGALGSEGAWLSKCYCGKSHSGLCLWEEAALRETLIKTWEKGFQVACHAIGDAAAAMIVGIAAGLNKEGVQGILHIEHGELIRGETIELMRGLPIEVHLQPSHWLSDQLWLKNKVGDLVEHAFPWRKLQEAEIAFDFGSDAPIEPTSIGRIFQALRQSAEAGIPRLLGLPTSYMGHRDLSWAPNSFTLLEEEAAVQVVFRGEHLI
jgi:predicted amidohydrolase YtcJ